VEITAEVLRNRLGIDDFLLSAQVLVAA